MNTYVVFVKKYINLPLKIKFTKVHKIQFITHINTEKEMVDAASYCAAAAQPSQSTRRLWSRGSTRHLGDRTWLPKKAG